MVVKTKCTLRDYVNYVNTWSYVRTYRQKYPHGTLPDKYFSDLLGLYPPTTTLDSECMFVREFFVLLTSKP